MNPLAVAAGVSFLFHVVAYLLAWFGWPRPRTRLFELFLAALALSGLFASIHSIAFGLLGLEAALAIARWSAIAFNLLAFLFVLRALNVAVRLRDFGESLSEQIARRQQK